MSVMYIVMEYGGITLAIIFFIVAVILFIKWNIPKVCGEVTGTTQKKAIEKIRKERFGSYASKQDALQKYGDEDVIRMHKTNTDELFHIQSVRPEEPETAQPEEDTIVLSRNERQDELTMVLAVSTEDEMMVPDVIEVAEEVYTQPGSVANVLDIVITHTRETLV